MSHDLFYKHVDMAHRGALPKDTGAAVLWAENEIIDQHARILFLIMERDGYRFRADQKVGMRKEIEEALGFPERSTNDEQEFMRALRILRGMKTIVEAARLRRNTVIHDDDKFEGRWVAVPEEDFDKLYAALAAYDKEGKG